MKKGWMIALCVLLALLIAAGFGYYRLRETAGQAASTQRALYDQYQAMMKNAENAKLTLTEDGKTLGEYSLAELGVLDRTQAAITASFDASERMAPETFRAMGLWDKIEWRAQSHTEITSVAPDMTAFSDASVVSAVEAVRREAAQDAYLAYDGEKIEVVSEVAGTEVSMDALREALRAATQGMAVSAEGAPEAALEVSDFYLPPEVTEENGEFDFDAFLDEKIQGVTLRVDLNLAGETDEAKIKTLAPKDLAPLVSSGKDGKLKIDRKALEKLADGWVDTARAQNVSFILDTYVDGPRPMDFLKVDYELDTGALTELLEDAILKLTASTVQAPLTCYKNGEVYEPLTKVYVEVDIDNQRLTVYKAGEVVISTDVVTGNLNGHQTITGLYYAYNKDEDQWMEGEDYLVFSDYWIGISGAYGMHDASWRTHFGKDFYVNGGSHGCVNIPVEAMPTIYETVEVGDAVILFGANKWFEPDPETTRILQS